MIYAYIVNNGSFAEGFYFEIVNIANPLVPVHNAKIAVGGNIGFYRIYVSGNYAYLSAPSDDLVQIYDISDPDVPVYITTINNGGAILLDRPRGLFVLDDYLYVASHNSDALEIINISNPAAPVHAGSLVNGAGGALLDGAEDVVVVGNYAYVTANRSHALEIVDVSNPAAPAHAGSLLDGAGGALLLWANKLFIRDNYAYITVGAGLEIVDISNPAAPAHAGSLLDGAGGALLAFANGIVVWENYAYIASTNSDALEIVDISNPAAPVHAGSLVNGAGGALLDEPYGIQIRFPYVYIPACTSNALEIVDVSNPAAPAHAANIIHGAGGANLKSPFDVFVTTGVVVWFTYSPATGVAPVEIQFSSVINGGVLINVFWDFGDGYTSTLQNPAHKFLRAGVYTVTFTANTNLGSDTYSATITISGSNLIAISQFCLRFAVESNQGIEWSEYTGDDWVVPVNVLKIIDDNNVPRMLIEEADGIVWEDATFDRIEFQQPSYVDKYYEENLRSGEFRWTASGAGVNEYYLEKLSGGDPEYSEPKEVYIGNLPSPQGVVGTLQPGFYDYGDNDALGYDTLYVRLPDDTDPDTKDNGYVIGVYWSEIACEEWYGEEVSDPNAEESKQEVQELHWYTRPQKPENKGSVNYNDFGYRDAQEFSVDIYVDGNLTRPFSSVSAIPENGDIVFSGVKVEGRRIMPVFKTAASEVLIVGRNLYKIIKPSVGSRTERTMDHATAELALATPVLFIGRDIANSLLNRATGETNPGTVGVGIGPDGFDGSAIVIPAAGLTLNNAAIAGVYTFIFWRSIDGVTSTVPGLPALTQIGETFNNWQLMYVTGVGCPAAILITQGLVSGIRLYSTNVVTYLTLYYNSMRYDPEPKPFEPIF